MTEEWIDGEGIRSRLRTSGKTQRQLATILGIDASGVSRLLDGGRKLRDDELVRIRAFFDPAGDALAAPPTTYRLGPTSGGSKLRRSRPGPASRDRALGDIPIYAAPIGRGRPYFELSAAPPAEYLPRPDQLHGVEDAFGLFAPGDSLAPRYRSGETLFIHPTKPPAVGLDCFIRLRSPEGAVALLRHLGGDEAVARFSSVNSTYLCSEVPRSEILTLERREIVQIGRIVMVETG